MSPPGACTWKIALKYKVKQSKNGKFTSNYKASPIEFETQISVRRAPPNISPSKRAFEKCKPRGLFSEFYGFHFVFSSITQKCDNALTSTAASECLSQFSTLLGPSILRGRIEMHNPR